MFLSARDASLTPAGLEHDAHRSPAPGSEVDAPREPTLALRAAEGLLEYSGFVFAVVHEHAELDGGKKGGAVLGAARAEPDSPSREFYRVVLETAPL
ncbi:MAG: hypothetical protein ACRD21_07335 [Vicinamibacteria bacterium]